MKSKLVFLFLLVCVSYTSGQDDTTDAHDDNTTDSTKSTENSEKYLYPCSLDDMECIRDYFANTGLCKKTSHEDGVPIEKDIQVAYMPKFNCSLISLEDTIVFHGSSMEAFKINPQTNNLIMTINFVGMNIHSPRAKFVLYLRGEEPMIVEEYANVTYAGALTAIIPKAGLFGVIDAVVSSYNTNPMPPFEVGPKISNSSDVVVSNFYNALVSDIPTAVQELLLFKAPYFFYIYLQEYICNYGLDYIGMIL